MARINKHGETIGTLEYTIKTRRYMSDGTILQNSGQGWKIYGKVKPGVSISDVFNRAAEKQAEWAKEHPMGAAYKRAIHEICGQSKRWKLHTAIQMMPNDYDGVWSEVCDGYGDNVRASVDEIGEICRLYQAAVDEQARKKAA